MKLYLAGPMRGIPEFNFPAFKRAAAMLRRDGHEVFSPAENDIKNMGGDFSAQYQTGDETELAKSTGFTIRIALGQDLAWICKEADGIAMLPGWRNSKGATAEHAVAVALGLKVIELDHEQHFDVIA